MVLQPNLKFSLIFLFQLAFFFKTSEVVGQSFKIDSVKRLVQANFVTTIDKRHQTKDGIYLNGYVVELSDQQIRKLHGKRVRIIGFVTIVPGNKIETTGEIRQGKEVDTRYILHPTVSIIQ